MEDGVPVLPAATTNSAPVSADSVSTARAIGSVPSLGSVVPRLRETTSARTSRAAHSMPAMICDSLPEPWSPSTLPTARAAPGATPFSRPSEAAPLPPIVEVTCVPWPLRSATSSPSTKLRLTPTRSARSGWPRSTPVSRTATVTPLPVSPAAQAAGVPIRALLSAMSAVTRPSSQTASMPLPCRVNSPQKSRPLAASTAIPRMLGRVRVRSADRGVTARAPGAWVRISGSSPVAESPSPWRSSALTSNSRRSSVPARRYGRASSGTTVISPSSDWVRTAPAAPRGRCTVTVRCPPARPVTVTRSPVTRVTVRAAPAAGGEGASAGRAGSTACGEVASAARAGSTACGEGVSAARAGRMACGEGASAARAGPAAGSTPATSPADRTVTAARLTGRPVIHASSAAVSRACPTSVTGPVRHGSRRDAARRRRGGFPPLRGRWRTGREDNHEHRP